MKYVWTNLCSDIWKLVFVFRWSRRFVCVVTNARKINNEKKKQRTKARCSSCCSRFGRVKRMKWLKFAFKNCCFRLNQFVFAGVACSCVCVCEWALARAHAPFIGFVACFVAALHSNRRRLANIIRNGNGTRHRIACNNATTHTQPTRSLSARCVYFLCAHALDVHADDVHSHAQINGRLNIFDTQSSTTAVVVAIPSTIVPACNFFIFHILFVVRLIFIIGFH